MSTKTVAPGWQKSLLSYEAVETMSAGLYKSSSVLAELEQQLASISAGCSFSSSVVKDNVQSPDEGSSKFSHCCRTLDDDVLALGKLCLTTVRLGVATFLGYPR